MKFKQWFVAFVLVLAVASISNASVVINFNQVGNDVVATGSGSINTSALQVTGGAQVAGMLAYWSVFGNEGSAMGIGPRNQIFSLQYLNMTGPNSFNTQVFGSTFSASSGTGDRIGLFAGTQTEVLFLDANYESGALLTTSSTWANTTIDALYLKPGTYSYTWGSDTNADFLTVNINGPAAVPEPSTYALFSLGLGGLALWKRRRQKA